MRKLLEMLLMEESVKRIVTKSGKRFHAKVRREGSAFVHNVGFYDTKEQAEEAMDKFIKRFEGKAKYE